MCIEYYPKAFHFNSFYMWDFKNCDLFIELSYKK